MDGQNSMLKLIGSSAIFIRIILFLFLFARILCSLALFRCCDNFLLRETSCFESQNL